MTRILKTNLLTILLAVGYHLTMAQITTTHLPNTQVRLLNTGIEKIRIPFSQSPLLHSDGGWEKGPSNWQKSNSFPVDYRGGLLLLDRKANGMVHYLSVNLRFIEAGSIEVTANSMSSSKAGVNPWQKIFGKQGQIQTVTMITQEADFATELHLFLRDFKPYKPTQVN